MTDEMRGLNGMRIRYHGCLSVDCEKSDKGRRGGLCMMWREPYDLQLVSFYLNHILCMVDDNNQGSGWMCSGLYGWPETSNRMKTWRLLEAIYRTAIKPWVCFGDFNEIMWNTEKCGGNLRSNFYMGLFRDTIARCDLKDLGFTGAPFTWSNGRKGDANIKERLDRVLANDDWLNKFPSRQVRHLPRYKLDHAPVVLEASTEADDNFEFRKPRRFRFEHMWLQHPDFGEAVKTSWRNSFLGDNLMDQLQSCGEKLSQWARTSIGNIMEKKKELYTKLGELQKLKPTSTYCHEIANIEAELDGVC